MRNRAWAVIDGIGLGKNPLDVVACDAIRKPLQRLKLTHHTLLSFFGQAAKALIGTDPCPGAQWLSQEDQRDSRGADVDLAWMKSKVSERNARLVFEIPKRQGLSNDRANMEYFRNL
jgi:hypothetical protein